jgi:DNA mismatch endonuclease (patch repair protein)
MTDNIPPAARKRCMKANKDKNTSIELILRRRLSSRGLRYRLHYKLPGRPDIVFVSKKAAVFVDGCFWHKCPKCFQMPKSNLKYWRPKLKRNVRRARQVNRLLIKDGWRVKRYYECKIRSNPDAAVKEIIQLLKKK